jgi:hypothetical protein
MKNNEKILKLFKNFAGDQINIHGLIVIPVKVEFSPKGITAYDMYFDIRNPNNVPYYTGIVLNDLDDELNSFGDFINEKIEPNFIPKANIGLYLTGEVKRKIQNVFDSVKSIEFVIRHSNTSEEGMYELFIESVGLSIEGSSYEYTFYITNRVKVIRAKKDGDWYLPKSVVSEYIDGFLPQVESYWETETLYHKIDEILNNYPLLTDEYNNIVGYYNTKFIL